MDVSIKHTAEQLNECARVFTLLGLPVCNLVKAKYQLATIKKQLNCEHLVLNPVAIETEYAKGIQWECERCKKIIDFELEEIPKSQ